MRYILLLFTLSLAYALVRYVAFAPQNLPNVPIFIVNKAVSMGAALSFVAGFWQQGRRLRGRTVGVEPAMWFRAGVFGAVAHIPMSLALLRPAYFSEFFADGRYSFVGEIVLLLGALTAGLLYLLTRGDLSARTRWLLSLVAMGTLFVHVLAMGIARGLNIDAKHAYLPPMWLLSLVGVVLGVWLLMRSRTGLGGK